VTLASLKGKVVIVDFWAYSCINCQRELPHVEAWYKNYAADGLEVVGVQTPEYAFEHVPSNVLAGARQLGLTFPVALDNSYDTWNAYDNQSWPAAYLIDATGKIRFVSIGEGDYTQEEQLVRQLLLAAHPGIALPKATNVLNTTPDNPDLSPETYLGAERAQYYDGNYYSTDTFAFPAALPAHSFALSGPWTIGQQSITAGKDAAIRLSYNASYVYLDAGGTGTLTVTSAGGATKVIRVSGAPDIYTVAAQQPAGNGTVTIKVSPGLAAYSFTFG
jgi:thiol-disulfide isomerase/thioredoxin